MKKSFLVIATVILAVATGNAQIKNAQTATVKVYGNCDMCESTIEKAATEKKITKTDWDKESKMATITYNSKKISLNEILKKIALAGYDNQSFLAPDDAYNSLPPCCKYNRVKKHSPILADQTQQHNLEQGNNVNSTAQETSQLKAVFDKYFSLKDALVKTDRVLASEMAKNLQTSINDVKMDKLSTEVHIIWMKVLKDIKTDAEKISETNDIALQRSIFITLSKNMYELAKVNKSDEPVYYQFCPMANGGKGANWLSKESNIKNPYYGSQMLTCGKTVETIKQ